MTRQLMLGSVILLALGITVTGEDKPAAAPAAKVVKKNAQFERMKKLVGTWVVADKDGKPTDKVQSVIKLTGAGSAITETLFPGEAMEMVSVYHLDGDDLVMTHYCAAGNQPKMKADPKSAEGTIHFQFAGGTNFDPAKDMHMHEGTLKFIDNDHIQFHGVGWVDGKPAPDHCPTFVLVRKK